MRARQFALTRARPANYSPNVALTTRAIDSCTRRTRPQHSLVTSCRLHSCSHCQLLNPFLADCCVTSCCAAASRPLLLSIWTSPPSNPFAWHTGHIVIWPRASSVTIAALGQPARCTLSINLFASHQLFAKMNAQGLVRWPPGNGKRGTCR